MCCRAYCHRAPDANYSGVLPVVTSALAATGVILVGNLAPKGVLQSPLQQSSRCVDTRTHKRLNESAQVVTTQQPVLAERIWSNTTSYNADISACSYRWQIALVDSRVDTGVALIMFSCIADRVR